MPQWKFDSTAGGDAGAPLATASLSAPDLHLALVVCSSQINRIVISRIVERCGLRTIGGAPQKAEEIIDAHNPGLIVLDGGVRNDECDFLAPGLAALRRALGGGLPLLIGLSTTGASPRDTAIERVLDAVVMKPLTPERLQPVVERLIAEHRR